MVQQHLSIHARGQTQVVLRLMLLWLIVMFRILLLRTPRKPSFT